MTHSHAYSLTISLFPCVDTTKVVAATFKKCFLLEAEMQQALLVTSVASKHKCTTADRRYSSRS